MQFTYYSRISYCRKILRDGKNQPQLVIRPPSDVAPFSDEWLAAIEAAGEVMRH